MILRPTYDGIWGGVIEDKRFYYAQNWRADVSVVVDDSGVQQERIGYSPYGQPYGIAAGDVDFDADHDAGDDTAIGAWSAAYRAYADVDLNGSIGNSDSTAADADSLGWDVLTSDDVLNRIGYAGYTHDRDIPTAAHVRYRVYKIDLGRWVQRDPLGYRAGVSLYAYASIRPHTRVDPMGLQDLPLIPPFEPDPLFPMPEPYEGPTLFDPCGCTFKLFVSPDPYGECLKCCAAGCPSIELERQCDAMCFNRFESEKEEEDPRRPRFPEFEEPVPRPAPVRIEEGCIRIQITPRCFFDFCPELRIPPEYAFECRIKVRF